MKYERLIRSIRHTSMVALLGMAFSGAAIDTQAAVGEAEAQKLGVTGTPLTPIGAIRAGNADGSIPAWTGGITEFPAGYKKGDWYVDPFAKDEILFTITADNYTEHMDRLSIGHVEMFKKYPDTYKMHVYPSHRSASFPDYVYERTMKAATQAGFCGENVRCLYNPVDGGGFPFPIPTGDDQKKGLEIMWNGMVQFLGKGFHAPTANAFLVSQGGDYVNTLISTNWLFPYWWTQAEKDAANHGLVNGVGSLGVLAFAYTEENIYPPRQAGTIILLNQGTSETRMSAYVYVPGQRRVRKAPEIGYYDSPGSNSDGLRTADQRRGWTLSGEEEIYNYTLHGLKEIYIPYNTYKLAQPEVNVDDVIRKGHINQDLVRYELHRVWVLEGNLKEGFRHLGPRRILYVDEDTWVGALHDMWDTEGDYWRFTELYLVNTYDIPATHIWGTVYYDLKAERYVSSAEFYNLSDNPRMLEYREIEPTVFTPQGLRRLGVR